MTQQEVTALKAKFQAGGYPSQQAFDALIDAIATAAAGSGSANSGTEIPKVILTNDEVFGGVTYNSNGGSTSYTPISIESILSAKSVDMTDKDYVVIVNKNFWNSDSSNKAYVSCGNTIDNQIGITVIDINQAVMFCKYTDYNNNTVYTPLDRSITITPYELSQLAQGGNDEYGGY